MAQVRGVSRAERDRLRAENTRQKQIAHVVGMARTAQTGHDKVVAATQAAKAASRRLTDKAARRMALDLAQVVECYDVPGNWEAK